MHNSLKNSRDSQAHGYINIKKKRKNDQNEYNEKGKWKKDDQTLSVPLLYPNFGAWILER